MLEKVKISIDVMGGDNSPDKTLEGINLFIKRNQNINDYVFYLFGNETIINQKLNNFKYIKNNYKIFDTKIVVTDDLSAISSIKKGKDSSMWKAIQSQIDLTPLIEENHQNISQKIYLLSFLHFLVCKNAFLEYYLWLRKIQQVRVQMFYDQKTW